MKLKGNYLTQDINGTQFLVPVGEGTFSGMVRSNDTAAFIVDRLRRETTADAIVEAMYAAYDAPKETIAADVKKILDILRSVGALEE